MSDNLNIGVLGATSHVGAALLPMLLSRDFQVMAFSRKTLSSPVDNLIWEPVSNLVDCSNSSDRFVPFWISLAPIWVLPNYFNALKARSARRLVILSSTSRFSKGQSADAGDRALAQCFVESEERLQRWAEENGIEWVILRPTLIYGLGNDKNVCEIIGLIRRFGLFPLFGKANGLRQPVHCADVANACVQALFSERASNHSYNISGGETLTYRAMVERLFHCLGRKPVLVELPPVFLRWILTILRLLPRYRHWNFSMVERMSQDLVFDYSDAVRDLEFCPRSRSQ